MRYYLKRAGETAKHGVHAEIGPLQKRVQGIIDEAEEPEPGRVEKLREDLADVGGRAEGEAKEALATARDTLESARTLNSE